MSKERNRIVSPELDNALRQVLYAFRLDIQRDREGSDSRAHYEGLCDLISARLLPGWEGHGS